jgi:hypothetical protein
VRSRFTDTTSAGDGLEITAATMGTAPINQPIVIRRVAFLCAIFSRRSGVSLPFDTYKLLDVVILTSP